VSKKPVYIISGNDGQHENIHNVEVNEKPNAEGHYGYLYLSNNVDTQSRRYPITREIYKGRREFIARVPTINNRQ
jgi:hypothetical protein